MLYIWNRKAHYNRIFIKNQNLFICLNLIIYYSLIIDKIFQFAGWVSAAAVPKLINGEYYLLSDFNDTRNAYLFFSTVGFCLAIIFYLFLLFNLVQKFTSIPWHSFVIKSYLMK